MNNTQEPFHASEMSALYSLTVAGGNQRLNTCGRKKALKALSGIGS